MYERFTDRARTVMELADQEALRFNHEYIGTEHLLLGLIKAGSGTAASLLKHFGVDLDKVRIEVEKLVQSGRETNGRRPLTLRTKRVIEFSIMEARHLNHGYVGTEHILLGLLREHEGIAGQVLTQYFAIRLEEVREAILRLSEPREEAE